MLSEIKTVSKQNKNNILRITDTIYQDTHNRKKKQQKTDSVNTIFTIVKM